MRKIATLIMFFFFTVAQVWAQNQTVTGKVTDEKGAAVAGATVRANGANYGTSTGADGSFSITIPASVKSLNISGIGLATQSNVAIPRSGAISVRMAPAAGADLDEVVVQVPYGSIKKTSFTGSEGTVTAKQMERQQVASFTKTLEGLVPGLNATNGGGAPGSNADIRIRGIGSINGNQAPLYVLNGVVYDGSISSLDPADIETVTVLKDAASTALYGARGSNGVIMITTKRGKRGKAQINVRATQGYISRGIPEYDRIGSKDYYEMMWEASRNAYVYGSQQMSFAAAGVQASNELTGPNGLVYNAYNVPGNQLINSATGKINPNARLLWEDSWEQALFRVANRQNINTSIAGAGDKSDYLVSMGYLNEEGTMIKTGFKRYNMRLNVNSQANDWLKTGLNVDGAYTLRQNSLNGGTATSNPFYYSRQMGPIYPVYQRNLTTGAYVIDPATGQPALDWGVPTQMGTRPYAGNSNNLGSLQLDDRNSRNLNANANTYMDIKINKHFSFKTTFGINLFTGYNTTHQNSQFGDAAGVKGRTTKSTSTQVSYTLNEVLSWNQSFGKHNFNMLVGHENYSLRIDNASATRTGFAFPGQTELGSAAVLEGASSSVDHLRIQSVFSNLNYDFDRKYLISASIRKDGNSRFAEPVRWGNFASVGAGWRVSEEAFMKKASWINELKLKANYGSLGNEGIGTYYAYQNLYVSGFNNANASGYIPNNVPPNTELKWEKPTGSNFGVDFVLFNRKLTGSIDYFRRGSEGLFFDVPLPPSTGNAYVTRNIAEMINYGWEVQLGYNAITKKNFDWRIDVNFTTFKNEITKMPAESKEVISGTKKLSEGHSIYDFFIREFAGVDAATGLALYYKDVLDAQGKATGQRTVTDKWSQGTQYYVGGTALPDFSGGVTNTFRFKNYELSILTTFSYGGKFYDGNYQGIMHFGSYGTAWHSDILNRWQKPGDVTNVPRVQNAVADQDGVSTRHLFDGSFLNIKNITLTYNLPKATATKLHLNGLSVFTNVDNAWLFTAKKGMDPQRNFAGTADATFPPTRTITFGLNVNL
ncbi:MAG: SusC/RagA family TonB-linked outer membrane protein [Chitinophagaceae bacterium]|nr:SusC/RagA family TonB-linked outer membrane protein [Chitinophagaceae bacterium]